MRSKGRRGLFERIVGQAPDVGPVGPHHEDVAGALTAALPDRHLVLEAAARARERDPFVRPDLVDPAYGMLPRQAGRTLEEVRDIAGAPRWQGYLSDPARASAAHGQAIEEWWIEGFADLIVRAIRSEKMAGRPRFPDAVPPPVAAVTGKALANEAAFDATLQQWLVQRRQR